MDILVLAEMYQQGRIKGDLNEIIRNNNVVIDETKDWTRLHESSVFPTLAEYSAFVSQIALQQPVTINDKETIDDYA